ncbi:MAG TPA: methionine ABC transporter ATP-binding protein [Rhodobacteraceae bacterium]|jgi:peptide/nickel transport system ATP-binding protein|nr:methionine ABC transporter ATP-binding protein [Paracoccaceae bacterium]
MSDTLLSVKNLVVEFPTRRGILTAVDNVSFDLERGEVLGLVGESGAGKSITGSAVIGLIEPPGRIAAGTVHLAGQRIDNLPSEKMRRIRGDKIGMVFQDPLSSLNPLYSVAEQLVETILTHKDISKKQARDRAIELLDEVGIPAADLRIDDYPHQFSGGMRQRVVIALALCADPELIIADEPTTALDVSVQSQIVSVLKKMCSEHGASVILITHDIGVIAEVADRVAVLYSGRMAEIGPVRDVIKHPQHPYTKGLMGSIPTITQEGDRLTQIPGSMPRLTDRPPGCAFAPRCEMAMSACHHSHPSEENVGTARVACHLITKMGAVA